MYTLQANAGGAGGMWVYYIMIAALFGSLYVFSIRPQNKREKELKNLREHLEVGDEVMTIGGFYGTVVRMKDDKVTIASGAEKTKLEISKSAISTVLNRELPKAGKGKEEAEDKNEKASPKTIKKLNKKNHSDEAIQESEEETKEE